MITFPRPTLDFILAELGKTPDGILSIARMREVSKILKEKIENIIQSSQIFRKSFETRPIELRAFRHSNNPRTIIHEIFTRHVIYTGHDPKIKNSKFPLERAVSASIDLLDKLYEACKDGSNEEIDSAFDFSKLLFDLCEYCSKGFTALQIACYFGKKSHVEFLLDNGAKVDQPSGKGITPLCFAVRKGKIDIIEFLIDRGASPNGANWSYSPPLHWTPLSENGIPIVNMLIKKGANPLAQGKDGNTFLHLAGIHPSLITELVETWKVPIDITNKDGSTAMAESTTLENVKHFLNLGANPHKRNKKGNTPFTMAASKGDWGRVEAFLDFHPELGKNISDIYDSLIRGWEDPVSNKYKKTFEALIRNSYDKITPELFILAFKLGRDHIVLEFLDQHFDELLNPISNGNDLIHYAALYSRPELIHKLVKTKEVPVDLHGQDGKTALMQVLSQKNPDPEIINLLLDLGANPKLIDSIGMPLFYKKVLKDFYEGSDKSLRKNNNGKNLMIFFWENRHKEIQNVFGYLHEKGIGTEKNLKMAFIYYKLSAKQGLKQAQCNLGICYEVGKGTDIDLEKAFHYYNLAADQGDSRAQYHLAICYEFGRGVKKNLDKAFSYYKLSANQNNPRAQCNLGVYYSKYNKGKSLDSFKALDYYSLSARQNDPRALEHVSSCYRTGLGTEINLNKSYRYSHLSHEVKKKVDDDTLWEIFHYCKLSADKGNTSDQNYVGCCYVQGIGTEKDPNEAFRYFKLAARKMYPKALYNLGDCYEKGIGTDIKPKKAFYYYKLAAMRKNPNAQTNLGVCYEYGKGTKKDKVLAFHYYKLAADQEYPRAQCKLGLCYTYGIGTEEDPGEAFGYIRLAAVQNDPEALTLLGIRNENGINTEIINKEAYHNF